MFCSKCGEENPENAVFCRNCGEKLKEEVKKAEVIDNPPINNDYQRTHTHQTTTQSNNSSGGSDWLGCCLCIVVIFIVFAIFGAL